MEFFEDLQMLKAIADENRLKIVISLGSGEKNATSFLEEMDISQSTLSHHMKILCESGVVDMRKAGRCVFYSIAQDAENKLQGVIAKYLKA